MIVPSLPFTICMLDTFPIMCFIVLSHEYLSISNCVVISFNMVDDKRTSRRAPRLFYCSCCKYSGINRCVPKSITIDHFLLLNINNNVMMRHTKETKSLSVRLLL